MRKTILIIAVGAVALMLASFTRPPTSVPAATLASISHLELMQATSSLPEAEPGSTF
jgi:hypothetical protein